MNKINCLLKNIDIRHLTELNNTMHVPAAYVTKLVGANKIPKTNRQLGGRDG